MIQPKVDGREAYRDDPDYTSPEMQPGMGEDIRTVEDHEGALVAATGLSIGAAGGLLAGELLVEEAEAEALRTR